MQGPIFFDGWEGPLRIALIAPAAYASLVLFLRISGKRTLTKLNAFDLVITVALGSTLATQILSRDTPLLDGMLAFAGLISLQWLVAFLSVRSRAFRKLVRSEPRVLLRAGIPERRAMQRERITESELLQAVRAHGGEQFDDALAVFLQTDGSLAVIMRGPAT
jgi:uncharacterized membrane protein YcaP (DUF421 family)